MWLLERTIKHPENDIKLRNALSQLNIDFMEIEKRPFEKTSYEKFKDIHFDFVYASTNVIEDLNGQCSGIYFNEENFNYHYIIEAQCSNSSGFYDCDLIQLIKSISEAAKNEKRTGFIS